MIIIFGTFKFHPGNRHENPPPSGETPPLSAWAELHLNGLRHQRRAAQRARLLADAAHLEECQGHVGRKCKKN